MTYSLLEHNNKNQLY